MIEAVKNFLRTVIGMAQMNDNVQNTTQYIFRSPFWALIFIVVVYFAASLPLLTGTTTLDSEVSQRLNPAFFFYHYSQVRGESPAIAPQISSGSPLSVSDWLYDPLNLILLNLFPPAFAYAVREFLNLVLAGIAAFLLAYYGLRRTVFESLVATLVYTTIFPLIQVFQSFAGIMFFLLPFFLLVLLRLGELQPMYGWKFWLLSGAGGALLGYGVLAMYAAFILYLVVGGFIVSIFFLLTRSGLRERLGCFIGFFFMLVLGVFIGSPHIARVLAFIPGSARASGLLYGSESLHVRDLIHLFFPPTMLQDNDVLIHFGPIGTILLLMGLFVVTDKRIKYIFGSIAVFVLLIALPYALPLWLLSKIPPFSLFPGTKQWLTLGLPAASLFAACGAGWLFHSDGRTRYWQSPWSPKRTYALFWGIGAFVAFYVAIYIPVWWNKVAKKYVVSPEVMPTATEMVIPLIIVASFITVVILMVRHKLSVSAGAWMTLGLLTANTVFPVMVYASKYGLPAKALYSPSALEKILKDREGDNPFRIFPLWYNQISLPFVTQKIPISIEDRVGVLRTIGAPNFIFYSPGLSTAEGSWQLTPARYKKALEAIRGRNYESLWPEDAPFDKIQSHLKLLGMMNVKYLISYIDLPPRADLPIVARFSVPLPSSDTPLPKPQWVNFSYDPQGAYNDQLPQEIVSQMRGLFLVMTIYENTHVLPRIFVPYAVSRALHFSEDTLFAPNHDYRTLTFIECASPVRNNISNEASCSEGKNNNAPVDITLDAYHNGVITFSYDAAQDSWLVISESNIPGWRATLDGTTPIPIETANGIYLGLRVPAGRHRVTLTYELAVARDIPRLFKEFATKYFKR